MSQMSWLKDNWEKVVGALLTVGGALLAVYRRFTRMEARMDALEKAVADHLTDDLELRERIDRLIERMDQGSTETAIVVASHETLLRETRADVRELRDDVKQLLKRS